MKTCSACGRIYTNDELVFCTEDGTPLSAPATQQDTQPINNSTQEPTVRFSSHNNQTTLVMPEIPTDTPDTDNTNTNTNITTNPLPWWLFGGSVFVIIGLVAVLVLVVVFIFLPKPTPEENKNQTQQRQNSNTSNQNKAEETEDNIVTTLQRLNDEVGAAYKRSDVEVLSRLLADDYEYRDYKGFVWTKAQVISMLKSGALSYEYMASSNVSVRVGADKQRANVTGQGAIRGQLNGNSFIDAWSFNAAYEKREGKWLLVTVTTWR